VFCGLRVLLIFLILIRLIYNWFLMDVLVIPAFGPLYIS